MSKKIVGKGKPLEELVKGSLTYTLYAIRRAFQQQFNLEYSWRYYIVDAFDDAVIVAYSELPEDEFYRVPYTREGASYTFATKDDWELVQLDYIPASVPVQERSQQEPTDGRRSFFEAEGHIRLLDKQAGKPRRVRAIVQTADIVNANGRRYPAPVIEAAVKEALETFNFTGPARSDQKLLGEVEHPSDKLASGGRASYLENTFVWDSLRFDGRQVLAEGRVIENDKGRNAIATMEAGVLPGISLRGWGISTFLKESGQVIEEVTELHYTAFDAVQDPADVAGAITILEGKNARNNPTKEDPMDLDEFRAKYPDQVSQIEKEHDARKRKELEEALQRKKDADEERAKLVREHDKALREQLQLSETDDIQEALRQREQRLATLEQAEVQRQVDAYVESQVKEIKYPEKLRARFLSAVQAAKPKTVDEAKATIIAKRGEYDAIMADLELAARGFGGVAVLGSVLERDGGVPEHLRAARDLSEALRRAGRLPGHNLAQPDDKLSINEKKTIEYLAKFDQMYRHHLVAEARLWQDAEQTSDLSLPYTVSRVVMAEVLPRLVGLSIFDVQMTDQGPTTNIFFETYEGETGAQASVTDEVIEGDHDQWVNIANKRLVPGTVVLTNSAGSTTYTEGTDYVIDYVNGKLKTFSTGTTTDAQSLRIDYTYDAIRKGEMAPIERAKLTLAYMALTIAADRLATQISSEAIVFSRSALGYDAVARTLERLIEQVRIKIDKGLLYLALTAALQVANNSGGTWTAATDPVEELIPKIGVAKTKVLNRYYMPTAIIMSTTNADLVSNWDGFTAAGERPDADLNAQGYLGRLKGLPVFESTEFSDAYILVVNREVVIHRILQPMQLKGPFPTYDTSTGELIAAEQWYAEEYNGSEAPVPEKASYVKVA